MYSKGLINDLSKSKIFDQYMGKNLETNSILAVGMARVSSKKQRDKGQSTDAQEERIQDYIKLRGYSCVNIFSVAESASKHENRSEFLKMLELVKMSHKTKAPINHIIFSHQSRSNRNRESAREIENLIKENNVVIHCVREGLTLHASSPFEDWLQWDIFNNLNAKFIQDHTKNVMDGTKKRLELGLFPGKAIYGYRNSRLHNGSGLSVFEVVKEEGLFIKTAFELFSTGAYSAQKLWDELCDKFPHTPKPKGFKSLYKLLRKRFYYGEFEYMGTVFKSHPEYQPAIISFTLWDKVQKLIDKPEQVRDSSKNLHYLSMITCGGRIFDQNGNLTDEQCGCKVTAERKRKVLCDGTIKYYYLYACSSTNKSRPCSQKDVSYMKEVTGRKVRYSQEEIELLFEELFKPLKFSESQVKWMQDILLCDHNDKKEDHEKLQSALQKRQKMLDHYMNQAYEDKLNGAISEEMWRSKHESWMSEKEEILEKLDGLDSNRDEYIKQGITLIELAQRTENIYKNASPEVKRKLVEIVSSNRILCDGSIEFYYRKPFNWLAESKDFQGWWRWWESNPRPKFCLNSGLRA